MGGRIAGDMATEPILRLSRSAPRGVLVWQWPAAVAALSSAAVGGGLCRPDWVVNIGVGSDYGRTDLAEHVAEVASDLDLVGTGVALLTAAGVEQPTRRTVEGVTAHATVGVSHPTWAAARDPVPVADAPRPGTINLVIQVPVALDGGAAVNAVITATEAKTQALLEAGIDGTGTATDAVVVVWPPDAPPERFAGPRSPWGQRIAHAVHAAVRAGLES